MGVQLQKLADFLSKYESAITWLQTHGVRIGQTRFSSYLKRLRSAVLDESYGQEGHQSDPEFINAVIEASEVVDISALPDEYLEDGVVLKKLQKIARGAEIMAPDGFDHARDLSFEFSMAAVLHREGMFGGFSLAGGDVTVGESRLPIECKRVSSLASLEKRLRIGRKKLDQLVRDGEPAGIVAVDLTRPIRAAQSFISAESDDGLAEIAEMQLTAYISKYVLRPDWLKALNSRAVLGLMFRYLAAGTSGSVSNVRRAVVWQICSLHDDDSDANQQLMQVARRFGRGKLNDISWSEIALAKSTVRT